jgi:hypothetical protein
MGTWTGAENKPEDNGAGENTELDLLTAEEGATGETPELKLLVNRGACTCVPAAIPNAESRLPPVFCPVAATG